LPDPWQIELPLHPDRLLLEVRPAPSGQTGLFLEQLGQWQWLRRVTPQGARVLSLFAHSGAASLALAAAGAEVVHVDASSQAVALARRNAAASHLAHAPIRWVCEDAHTFVARQLRRGERFDGVVLDPPSWGHGPKGQAFAIDRDLLPLLEDVAALVAGSGSPPQASPAGPILLSCHSSGWHPRRLHDTLADSFAACASDRRIESGELTSRDASGRLLAQGAFARIEPAA
ncbi:MAG: RsmD family RNA methyltransferase, partial [Planctomycetota bacterium]